MRAVLLEAVGAPLVVADDVEIEGPRAGEVLVRVTHCGTCQSDQHVFRGTQPIGLPVVLGHEAAGIVEELGAGVSGLAPGDRAILAPIPSCGRCYWCTRGQPTVCVSARLLMTGAFADGSTRLSWRGKKVFRAVGVGAFAERVVVPADGVVKVPADTPLDVACLIGCAVQTGVGAVLNTARVEAGASVLVIGLGGVGLSIVQGARIAGASRIIAVDKVASRREQALRLGATRAIDPAVEKLPNAVRAETEVGADYAFDAVGSASVVESALASVRKGGTVVCVGMPRADEAYTIPNALMFACTEKRLIGCLLGSSHPQRDFPRLLALWRKGTLDLSSLVTHRRPLSEVPQAMADLEAAVGVRTVIEV